MNKVLLLCFSGALLTYVSCRQEEEHQQKPKLADFIGINFHTVLVHDADLYAQTSRLARNYHPVSWDVWDTYRGKTNFPVTPKSQNGVNWDSLYSCWRMAGYNVHASLLEVDKYISSTPNNCFSKNALKELNVYGKNFSSSFGPGGKWPLVSSVEIENEPANLKGEQYAVLFDTLAKGLRSGNPTLKIATCAMTADHPAKSKFDQSIQQLLGREDLFDIITMHTYALKSGWPSFERSNPEDPSIDYLKKVDRMIAYRDAHPPLANKPIWITEFGFDAGTTEAQRRHSKWVSSSEKEQALWIVRSFLLFSEKDIERAYLYWFEDDDSGNFHGASGIVRKNKSLNTHHPKPAFYAMRHLFNALGDYRFKRVIAKQRGGLYIFEYEDDNNRVAWVAWSGTKGRQPFMKNLTHLPSKKLAVEKLMLVDSTVSRRELVAQNDSIAIMIGETPRFLFFEK